MLDQDPDESRALFDALLRLHEPALKLRRMRSALDQGAALEKWDVAQPLPDDRDAGKPGQQAPSPQASRQLWLGRQEQQATGFIMDGALDDPGQLSFTGLAALQGEIAGADAGDTVAAPPSDPEAPEQAAVPPPPNAAPQTAAAPAPETDVQATARAKAQLTRLERGDRVDLRANRQWLRADLAWVSDNNSLYMFVSRGGRIHSMTRSTLEKLLRSGHMRPLAGGPVVDKALKAIAANASLGAN
jgi:hypothetical protein